MLQWTLRHAQFKDAQAMRSSWEKYSYRPFDQHRCIFVHVPKTAGVSVSRALFGNLAGGHATIRHYQMVFAPAEFNSYFKFAFVRNPWDRLYSAYGFLKRGGMNEADAHWASEYLSNYNTFDDFVMDWVTPSNVYTYDHFVPQCTFLYLPGHSETPLDFIGRFEHLERDFLVVCNRLSLTPRLEHRNRAQDVIKPIYREAYSAAARERVRQVYREDVEMFAYTF